MCRATHWKMNELQKARTLKKNDCPSPRSHLLHNEAWDPPLSTLEFWLGHSRIALVKAAPDAVSSWVQLPCHVQKTYCFPGLIYPSPGSLQSFHLLFFCEHDKGAFYRCPFIAQHSTDTYSLHINQLCINYRFSCYPPYLITYVTFMFCLPLIFSKWIKQKNNKKPNNHIHTTNKNKKQNK